MAALTERELNRHEPSTQPRRCALFTDLASPVPNRIYPQIGYRRRGIRDTVRFTARSGEPSGSPGSS